MKKKVLHSLIVFAVVFFYSCGDGNPTERMGRKIFNEDESNKSAFFEATDFEKINGTDINLGAHYYEMKYTVKKIAKADLHEYTEVNDSYHTISYVFDTSTAFKEKRVPALSFWGAPKWTPVNILKGYKKGDFVKNDTGFIYFIKTENGWEKTNRP